MSKVKALEIRARREGYRRAGMKWSRQAIAVPAASLSKAQIEALQADPQLIVAEAEIDAPEAAGGGQEKADKKADKKV